MSSRELFPWCVPVPPYGGDGTTAKIISVGYSEG